jgi:AcrR family transcriptional regulator
MVPATAKGEATRAFLLQTAARVFAERGYAGAALSDLIAASGLTKGAFYFYFPSKAAAVAALLEDFYEEMMEAATDWYEGGDGSPLLRLRTGFEASIALWRDRAGLMVAMLDAVGTDPEVRDVWETWIQGFIERITIRIGEERAAGLARDGGDPHALATVLMGAALHTMEREVRAIAAGQDPPDALGAALIETWHRTIYQID